MIDATGRALLKISLKTRALVRVSRSIEPGHVDARVAAISARLVALAVVSDDIHPNGFEIYRLADVAKVKAAPYTAFITRALAARGEKLPRLGRVSLGSFRSVVADAAKRFALVTVYREHLYPDECLIGRPQRLTATSMSFLTIDPTAEWDLAHPDTIRWRDVTRVDFGGAYEEALALVGGRPPRRA